ncbi:MAG: hypothetical protein DMG19_07490 [Acidobacteria bacterium]|nr:MAG: hypothetical protein DMG19_07490 [Acidobacteriota bacterium]
MSANSKNAALEGIRVVEFAVFAAGPLVGKHLGEHGAEVRLSRWIPCSLSAIQRQQARDRTRRILCSIQ